MHSTNIPAERVSRVYPESAHGVPNRTASTSTVNQQRAKRARDSSTAIYQRSKHQAKEPGSRSEEGRGRKKLHPRALEERKEAVASAPHHPHIGPKEPVKPVSQPPLPGKLEGGEVMVQAQTPQTTPHIVPVQSALTTQHRDFFAQPRKPQNNRAGPTRHEAADPPAVRHRDRPSDQRFEDEPHRPGQRRGRLGGRVRQAPKADLQPPELRLEVQQLVKAGRADSRGGMGPPARLQVGVQGRRR